MSKLSKREKEARRQKIIQLSEQGLSNDAIAQKLSVSKGVVRRVFKNLKGAREDRERLAREKRARFLKMQEFCSKTQDRTKDEKLLILIEAGGTNAQIAETLGVEKCEITAARHELKRAKKRLLLKQMVGQRGTFSGTLVRFGKDGYGNTTVLLNYVRNSNGSLVADHLWLSAIEGFLKIHAQEGDRLTFGARVIRYLKGYEGYKELERIFNPVRPDFGLTEVRNVEKTERM